MLPGEIFAEIFAEMRSPRCARAAWRAGQLSANFGEFNQALPESKFADAPTVRKRLDAAGYFGEKSPKPITEAAAAPSAVGYVAFGGAVSYLQRLMLDRQAPCDPHVDC